MRKATNGTPPRQGFLYRREALLPWLWKFEDGSRTLVGVSRHVEIAAKRKIRIAAETTLDTAPISLSPPVKVQVEALFHRRERREEKLR